MTDKVNDLSSRIRKKYSPAKTLLSLLLLPIALLLITSGGVAAWNQWGTDGDVSRTLDRYLYFTGDPINVSLNYPIPNSKPVSSDVAIYVPKTSDVVFALDVSGSMKGEPLAEALAAVRMLSRALLASGASVGFMTFDHRVVSSLSPTNDVSVLDEAWRDISANEQGGTNIAQALEKASISLPKKSSLPRVVILVSDGVDADGVDASLSVIQQYGYGPTSMNEPINTDGGKVLFMAVGIGGEGAREFFEQTLYYPHQSSCCDALNSTALARKILDVALQSGLIKILGNDLQVRDYPHVLAHPYDAKEQKHADSMIVPRFDSNNGALNFDYPYVLEHQPLSYVLHADALGVHPIAEQLAYLSYVDQGTKKELSSGSSPWVFVLSWWLLLLMFLPALMYAFFALFTDRRFSLADPKALPEFGPVGSLPPVARVQFRRGTLQPLSPSSDHNTIPTVVIALGQAGEQMLSSLLGNRREAGLPCTSDRFLPIYLNSISVELAQQQASEFQGCSLDIKEAYHRIPTGGDMQALLQDIKRHPSSHPLVTNWFDYKSTLQDVSAGCGDDRMLARLALYKDLSVSDRESCQLEQLKDRVNKWKSDWHEAGETVQVMLLLDPRDGVGSGWMQDVAFHLRRCFEGKSIPIYAMLNGYAAASNRDAAEKNQYALMTELKALQGGNGWPWFNMEHGDGGSCIETSISLPLFDRVYEMQTKDGQAMHPAAAAANIMELMDIDAARLCHESLANTAVRSRSASLRDHELITNNDGLSFLTALKTTTIVTPILRWQQEITCWTMRDLLSVWFGYHLEQDHVVLDHQSDDPKQIWQQMQTYLQQIQKNRQGSSFSVWQTLMDGAEIDQKYPDAKLLDLHQEWLTLIADYMNGSAHIARPERWQALAVNRQHRFGNVMIISKNLRDLLADRRDKAAEKNTMLERPYAVMNKVLTHLRQWKTTILGDAEVSSMGLVHALSHQLEQVQQADPSLDQGGRVAVAENCIKHDNPTWYEEKIKPETIDSYELPMRMWWCTSADGCSMEILFEGMAKHRLSLQDFGGGALQGHLFDLLSKKLAPEMALWSLESETTDDPATLMNGVHHGISHHDFLFQNYHQEARITSLQESVKRMLPPERMDVHNYSDRLSLQSFSEFGQHNALQQQTALSQTSGYPFIQPLAKIPAALLREYLHAGGCFDRQRSDINAVSKLLAQNDTLLSQAVAASAAGMIEEDALSKVLPYLRLNTGSNGQYFSLTDAGDTNVNHALYRLLLLRKDRDGNALPVETILEVWGAHSRESRREMLQGFHDKVENQPAPEDWAQLLMWKARVDLEHSNGLLA